MKKDIPKEFLHKYEASEDDYKSALELLTARLELRLSQLAAQKGTRARLTDARVKRASKIWKKASEAGLSVDEALTEIEDILGIRIVCNNFSDIDEIIEMIRMEGGLLEITETKDMISEPTEPGYRATHVRTKTQKLYVPGGVSIPCEIQIRTLAQDTWARLSRADLYGQEVPTNLVKLTQILSKQLSAIDETAQLIRNELDRPADKSDHIKDSDNISPKRLALLYKLNYGEDIWEWNLQDWFRNLQEAEVETIKEVKELINDGRLRGILDKVSRKVRVYSLEDSEWVVYSALVAAEVNTESGIEAVKDRIETEWDELSTTIALRESLPLTIEDFIDELENVTAYRTKDSEDDAEEIKSHFSLLGCMSADMYGMQQLNTMCAVEALVAYYGDDIDEDRLTELIDRFVQAYE